MIIAVREMLNSLTPIEKILLAFFHVFNIYSIYCPLIANTP